MNGSPHSIPGSALYILINLVFVRVMDEKPYIRTQYRQYFLINPYRVDQNYLQKENLYRNMARPLLREKTSNGSTALFQKWIAQLKQKKLAKPLLILNFEKRPD